MGRRMRSVILVLLALAAGTVLAGMQEDEILSRYEEMVFRPNDSTLCIITSLGDTVSFVDNQLDESYDPYEEFILVSYFTDQNYWVVLVGRWEWHGWILINGDNGNEYSAISIPLLSPDGTRFLCMMDDVEAGFIDNGIEIWRIEEDTLVLEFSDLSVPWGPVHPEWVSDSRIEFQKMYYDRELREWVYPPGSIELDARGSWIPDDPSDWEL
jgi:hypothetical protein